MKITRFVALIVIITVLTSCVSPFYGTARIEKGFNVDIGVTGMNYIGAYGEWTAPSLGVMGNISVRYGFNPFLQLGTRFSVGYGQTGFGVVDDSGKFHNPWEFFPDGAINIQMALPLKKVTPALRLEGSYSHGLSSALLLGLGKSEKYTFGIRGSFWGTYAYAGLDLMVVARPTPRLSVYFGVDPFASIVLWDGFLPVATLGVGYKLK